MRFERCRRSTTSFAAVFSPMPGHTRQVVGRVAAQCRVLGVLHRRDAGALEDAGLVVERVVGDAALVVQHLDVRVVDELVRVAVAGDDHDVDALVGRLRRERRDHVVGLDARSPRSS